MSEQTSAEESRPIDDLLDRLAGIVGSEHVLADPALTAGYVTDWTGRFHGSARFVVRPATTVEVAAVVAACAAAGVAVVPQGGNTGLVGGSVPRNDVLLSLRRLAWIGPVDAASRSVTAGAGATLAALHEAGAPFGLRFAVDLSARDSATVGGLVATNAGGIHVLRYGPTRSQLLGVEAVLADGTVLRRLVDVEKDNAGYDLPGLLTGSEGTLAVVTAARLRLVPRWPHRVVALAGLPCIEDAVELARRARASVACLEAAEFFLEDGLELVMRHFGWPRPLPPSPAYVLLEAAASHDPLDELAGVLDGLDDAVVATDGESIRRLWAYREGHTDAIAAAGVPHKLDVSVPPSAVATFVENVRRDLRAHAPAAAAIVFGHVADGNVHVNVLGAAGDDMTVDDLVLSAAVGLGGSISAEHGIGRAKVRWLERYRSPVDIAAMRAVKRAFDPLGILNPGVLFD